MTLDAEVKFTTTFPGLDIDVNKIYHIPVDQDYVNADKDELFQWIVCELERMFGRTFSDREFEVKNFFDILDDLGANNNNNNNN